MYFTDKIKLDGKAKLVGDTSHSLFRHMWHIFFDVVHLRRAIWPFGNNRRNVY